ncbi:MAG: isopentenyl phosphate kinase [Methanobacteriota archaeon]
MKPLIVKLGGSVITDKRRHSVVKKAVLKRLACELTAVKGPLVVVHGGGSFGHPLASKYKIAEGYRSKSQLMGVSLTHRAMELLNYYVVEALQKAGIPAMAVKPSSCTVLNKGRIESMDIDPIKRMVALGLVPVLYGDVVLDVKSGVKILSGDQIVSYLARKLGASKVIMGADVDGVYVSLPKGNKKAELVRKITPADIKLVRSLGAAGTKDVTGGMRSKVLELLELAKLGIEAKIVNAAKPNILREAIQGKRVIGTTIYGRD